MSELVKIIDESVLDTDTKNQLKGSFDEYIQIANEWERLAKTIVVTDVTQVELMTKAKEGEKILRTKLKEIESTRKSLKEESLRRGKAIDEIARNFKELITPIADYLREQGDFAKNQEKLKLEQMILERTQELTKYGADIEGVDLGSMNSAMYNLVLSSAKAQYEAKQKEEQELKERLDKLESDRKVIVASYKDKDVMIVPIDLRNTTEDDFVAYIANLDEQIEAKKKAFELEETLKQEREANAEKERLAKIKADEEAKKLKEEMDAKIEEQRKENAEKERLAKIEADKEAERLKKELEDKLEAERKANELKLQQQKAEAEKELQQKRSKLILNVLKGISQGEDLELATNEIVKAYPQVDAETAKNIYVYGLVMLIDKYEKVL
jgi:hypothetical protein